MASTKLIDHSACIKTWSINAFNLKSDSMYIDVTLVPKDDNDQRFHCHRVVLASASTYFKNLFHNRKDVIYLTDNKLSANILKILIDYMYKAEIRINLENVVSLSKYSEEFGLNELHEETNIYMENNIKFDTCLKYWRHSVDMRNKQLINKCLKFIEENPEDFMQFSVNDFTETEASMETICKKLCGMKCDSIILTYVILWVKNDFGTRKFKLEVLPEYINLDLLSENDIETLENDRELQDSTAVLKLISDYHKKNKSLR